MSVSVWVLGVCGCKGEYNVRRCEDRLVKNQAILLYNRTILVFIICITYVHMYVYIRTYAVLPDGLVKKSRISQLVHSPYGWCNLTL